MSTPPLDADPAAWSAYEAVLARMDGPARVRVAIELSDAVRDIRLSGIESRHPELTREQAVARLILEEFGVTLPVAR